MTKLTKKVEIVKIIKLKNRTRWIKPLLAFGILTSSMFAQALSSSDYPLQWNTGKYKGLYFLEKEHDFFERTGKVCPDYRYAVILRHGTQNTLNNSPTQAIDSLVDHSENEVCYSQ